MALLLLGATDPPACVPTFVRLSEEPISVRVHPLWEIGFEAVGIGCEDALSQLTNDDLDAVRRQLDNLAKEKHIGVELFAADSAFTRATAQNINETISKDVFSDLFLFNFSFTEYAPVDDAEGVNDQDDDSNVPSGR